MNKFQKNKGFTLIELMVVMIIIAILATLGIVAYSQATIAARDGKRKADIETVRQALLLYRQDNTAYPTGTYAVVTAAIAPEYLSEPVPADPRPAPHPAYNASGGTATSFCVCADLESTTNKGNADDLSCAGYGTTGNFYCARP